MNASEHLSTASQMPGVAVVTGGASGIGRGVAHGLAQAGCTRIALLDLNAPGLDEVKSSILSANANIKILTLSCDTSNESDVVKAFDVIREEFKRLDYAINCAGIPGIQGPTDTTETSNFDRTIAINLRGVFLCAREELRIMKSQPLDCDIYPSIPVSRAQRGAIVNIGSGLGVVAMPLTPAYCASKAGVLALTRSDAVDYSSHKIRVNAVLPGIVETPMSSGSESVRQALDAHSVNIMTPLKRWGKPEEIADACIFLCSNKASFIQGASLPVDGGYLAI